MAKIVLSPVQSKEQQVTTYIQQNANLWNKLVGAIPADSTAVNVPEIVADFNELLALLRGLNSK